MFRDKGIRRVSRHVTSFLWKGEGCVKPSSLKRMPIGRVMPTISFASSGLAATFFREEGKSMKPLNAPYPLSLVPYP